MSETIILPQKHTLDGLRLTAAAIAERFKTTCTKTDISLWKSYDPPFPAPCQAGTNRYDRDECFAWFEQNIAPKRAAMGGRRDIHEQASEAKAKEIIRKAKDAEFDSKIKRKEYIKVTLAERAIVGFAKKYDGWAMAEIERNSPLERKKKLESLGIGPELVTQFYEWDVQQSAGVIDALKAKCREFGEGATGELKT